MYVQFIINYLSTYTSCLDRSLHARARGKKSCPHCQTQHHSSHLPTNICSLWKATEYGFDSLHPTGSWAAFVSVGLPSQAASRKNDRDGKVYVELVPSRQLRRSHSRPTDTVHLSLHPSSVFWYAQWRRPLKKRLLHIVLWLQCCLCYLHWLTATHSSEGSATCCVWTLVDCWVNRENHEWLQ